MKSQIHRLPKLAFVKDREAFIARICANKCVLHLGCADWPNTVRRLEDGTLLHMALTKTSKRVLGVDLSEEGVSSLRGNGFMDVVKWDVERLDTMPINQRIDLVVAGEILEHLSNPGLCLKGISKIMRQYPSKLLVSVPNAFSLRLFAPVVFQRTEMVHPAHTAYYSVTTLSELLGRYGFGICELYAYSGLKPSSAFKRSVARLMNAALFRFLPQISVGIMALAELEKKDYAAA